MPASELQQPSALTGRNHILVIDDDPLFRSLLVTILRRDFAVSVSSDGAEGFYLALEKVPTLAIVDIQMPGWDGLRTLQAFRSHPLLQSVPVIILTSDASRETVVAAIHGGADEYIVKTSFNREILLEKVGKLLMRGARRPSVLSPADAAVAAPAQDRRSSVSGMAAKLDDEARLQEVLDGWE
ncbi:response regulator [Planctellipticum variicoloris]|jgi:DNA-binding response OmpR family regulator|uniref:response regulator n=1 Tax=Planctellipticum variicoloris TaxID=3064265 RepID=UPI002CC56CAE|nr:response regulator [Planctomycetaceae bacterium SH412]HTN04340.1 response regulator [Planctomycetaceae bacterium]